jgi:hypothetical protein
MKNLENRRAQDGSGWSFDERYSKLKIGKLIYEKYA